MDRLCECGCGQTAPIATTTSKRYGWVKGQPKRYVHGHNGRKTPGINYSAAHKYLSRNYPKAGICEGCRTEDRTEYALIHGRQHSHDRSDYRELCVPCHKQYDIGGERASNVKLTAAQVREIRGRYAADSAYGALTRLGQEYGVTPTAILLIVTRKNWAGMA